MAEKRVFSKDQTAAIETRDRTLLVSAAAGSGKTTTLTERIIRSLLDEQNPESLQNMLIVTFTNASVADLVRKIGEAVEVAVREHPENRRLERELYLLPNARIRTIDAFCNEILRANTDKIGVPPNYRIAESAEIKILSESLLDTLISAAYDGALAEHGITPLQFEALCDSLTDTKSTHALGEIFAFLYEKSKNAIDGVGIFEELANIYLQKDGASVEETVYGADLLDLTRECIKYLTGITSSITSRLVRGIDSEVRDAGVYTVIKKSLEAIPTDTYSNAREAILSFTFPGMPPCTQDEKTEALIKCRNLFTSVKAIFSDLRDRFYQYDEEMWSALFRGLHESLMTLSRFLAIFDKAYMAEKLRRAMLEYSDIEKLAYDCLYNPDGTLTEVAMAYRSSLTSVYIDEYQDVNELQDAIFAALSNGKNRFMVGDIKQSIYVFRSAKPEIFASMKDSFMRLDSPFDSSAGATIFMSENYRCDRGIIDFVNGVFDRMFYAVKNSIGYVKEDRLTFAKKYKGEEPEYFRTEINIVERPDKEDEEKSASPRFVAAKIKELIREGCLADGSPISPADIAIVLRKRDGIPAFADALEELGIKADRGVDKSFFMNAEIRLVLCLLNAIDNPSKDIYLAGVMCSPIFNFTADEMLKYRYKSGERTLYRSLLKYVDEHPEENKLSAFLSRLSHYRTLSEGMHVYDLIRRLYRECGLLALAAVSGSRDNLMMLYNYARKYESSSYKGLYNFITYVNNIVDMGESIDEKSDTGSSDSVKITTVHSSKGLEYPIVFFAEASRPFSNRDIRGRVAYSEGYGMAYYMRTDDGLALAENPAKHIIHEKMKEKFFEEELRVLYVALTRAKERLYVVADLPIGTEFDEYIERARIKSESLSAYSVRHFSSYLEMMLASGAEADIKYVPYAIENDMPKEESAAPQSESSRTQADASRNDRLYELLTERFSYTYPDKFKTDFPEKLSVSRLYPTVLDGADEGESVGVAAEGEVVRRRTLPDFISGTEADESAERGIATHMVLQFCDLENLMKHGGEYEVERLAKKEFLSEKNVRLIRMPEIDLFVKSELFVEMYNAKKLYRELRFNSRLDSTLFTEDKERAAALDGTTVLVQGVIDCIIEDSDGELHLVDYKTDRMTREEFKSHALAEKKMNDKHALQLTYYSLAIEKMFGKRPKTVRVYSLPLGRCLDIKTKI